MNYNKKFNIDVKAKKQYFGCSENTDVDILKYKGVDAYTKNTCTKGFHLDSQIQDNVYIDGNSGYTFDVVSAEKVGNETKVPRIINADYMSQTIYKDINTCKFTVFFYGDFDGWDITRE
jgi:hypothetical protein